MYECLAYIPPDIFLQEKSTIWATQICPPKAEGRMGGQGGEQTWTPDRNIISIIYYIQPTRHIRPRQKFVHSMKKALRLHIFAMVDECRRRHLDGWQIS